MNPTATPTNTTTQNLAYPQGEINQIDSQLNEHQGKAYQALEEKNPDAVKAEEKIQAEIDLEVGEFAPPEIPDFTEMYLEMRKKYGLDQLDKALADLKNDYRGVEALSRERRDLAMNQQVSMDVIGGRTGEIERQANQQLDTLGRQMSYITDMHNSALSVVNMIMQFEQTDYQNAFESYKTAFDARMSQYSLKKELAQQELDNAFREKQFMQEAAMANLTILADMAAAGNWDYNNLSAEQKAAIGKMEVQAGLPVGFLSNIKVDPAKRILNTSEWTDASGNTYLLISKIGADGNITVEKQLIGKSSSGGSGGGGGTAGERAAASDTSFSKAVNTKGSPQREATIKILQAFGKSSKKMVTDNKRQVSYYETTNTISYEDYDKAAQKLALEQGISADAAYSAIDTIMKSHHYKFV